MNQICTAMKKYLSEKDKRRLLILSMLAVCVLFCGWTIPDSVGAFDIFDWDAVSTFEARLDQTDSIAGFNDNTAQAIVDGIKANLSADVYSAIELPRPNSDIGLRILEIINNIFK